MNSETDGELTVSLINCVPMAIFISRCHNSTWHEGDVHYQKQ